MVITSDQVVIKFDGFEDVAVTVPESYQSKKGSNQRLKGLCGNFDGDASNDLVDYTGTNRTTVQEFASIFKDKKSS